MRANLIAKASSTINAPVSKVWDALINPFLIKKYFFGVDVVSDWQVGSSIVWKGMWQGNPFEDKGKVLKREENHLIQFDHYSPLMGKPDTPENHHTVTIELTDNGEATKILLSQDNNQTEEARVHSEKNWNTMLNGLKKLLEDE